MNPTRWQLALAVPAVLAALTFDSGAARADRVVVSGGVRVGGSVRVRPYSRGGGGYRPRGVRVRHYPRYYYGGGVYVGVRYASPPPPCYYEGCYGYGYYSQPAVAVAAPVVAPEPPLARFGLGLFGGGTELGGPDGLEGHDIGLMGRLRLTDHLLAEGELAKSELFEGTRVDRSMGGALLYDFAPWSRLSLYVLGGLGAGSTAIADNVESRFGYAELGVGVEWRLTDRLSAIADLRAGQRQTEQNDEVRPLAASSTVAPADHGDFSRGRLGLMLFF